MTTPLQRMKSSLGAGLALLTMSLATTGVLDAYGTADPSRGAATAMVPLETVSEDPSKEISAPGEWSAWVGCWEPVIPGSVRGRTAAGQNDHLLCLIPTSRSSTLEIVTLTDGQIAERTEIEATGKRVEQSIESCSGWESADWSADGRRLYLNSEYTCPGEMVRQSSGLIAMLPGEEWLHVESMRVGDNTATRTLRYRLVSRERITELERKGLPAELFEAHLASTNLDAQTARLGAAAPLAIPIVIEAAEQIGESAVQSWLFEVGQGFALNAERILQLDDARLDPDLIDLMVALSYPDRFVIDHRPELAGGFDLAEIPTETGPGMDQMGSRGYWYPDPYGFNPYYGYRAGLYSPSRAGFGYGYGYDHGWYPGHRPVIIIKDTSPGRDEPARRGGRVVNDRGYSQGRTGETRNVRPPSRGGSSSQGVNASEGKTTTPVRKARPRDTNRGGGT